LKLAALFLASLLCAQHPPDTQAKPCAARPESRQFDFWIGEWRVENQKGEKAGDSAIQLILSDCVVLENWTSVRGMSGKSFNVWNPYMKKWQQSWVADTGDVQDFRDGEFKDGVMRFISDAWTRDGKPMLRRLSFHHLGPDRVRQHSERSLDGGKTWATEYDFNYIRKK
jgi:hypothetical protein